ncbi:MAG: DsrE family protein [Nitrospirae bacterium]|nr:DsrE family protein [Nitrospirota bacterium]
MKRSLLVPAMAVLAVTVALAMPAAASEYGKQKVVYHFNNGDSKVIFAGLGNILNHIKAVGQENLDVVVVAHGDGLNMFHKKTTTPEIQSRIKALKMQGIKFGVCKNTLVSKKIDIKDLEGTNEKEFVQAGVAEIAHLQQKGYVYIKP